MLRRGLFGDLVQFVEAHFFSLLFRRRVQFGEPKRARAAVPKNRKTITALVLRVLTPRGAILIDQPQIRSIRVKAVPYNYLIFGAVLGTSPISSRKRCRPVGFPPLASTRVRTNRSLVRVIPT
jgi:hypothetical protein